LQFAGLRQPDNTSGSTDAESTGLVEPSI